MPASILPGKRREAVGIPREGSSDTNRLPKLRLGFLLFSMQCGAIDKAMEARDEETG